MSSEMARSGRHVDRPIFWEPSLSFLKLANGCLGVGAFAYAIALAVLLPQQTWRALAVLGLTLVTATVWLLLRRGRIELAMWLLAVGVWAFSTATSWYLGGVNAPAIAIYPFPILVVGWLVGTRAALATAALTSATTLVFVLMEQSGLMPVASPTPPVLRWGIQSGVWVMAAILIRAVVRSYRNRLEDVRALDGELSRAQAVARVGSWVYDLATGQIVLSPETCRIFDLPEGTAGSHDTHLARVHPDDRDAVAQAWQAALAGGAPFASEHRIITRHDTRWVREIAELELRADGRPRRGVGTTQDVTERRLHDEERSRAEAALRAGEAQLECVLGSTADGILAVDLDGHIILANARFAELWRVPPALIESQDANVLLDHVVRQVTDRSAFLADVRVLLPSVVERTDPVPLDDGRTFERFTSPLVVNGAVAGRVWSFRNITDRERAESLLRASEGVSRALAAMLRRMCDNVPDMIWAKGLDGRYVFANKAVCEQLLNAADTDEPLGATDQFFAERERASHPEQADWHTFGALCPDSDAITLAAGKPLAFEEFGNVKGQPLFLEVHKAPFYDQHGTVIGIVGSARNISDRKRLEDVHMQAQKLESLGTLAGGIAHDFNNILAAIRGNVDLAADYLAPDSPALDPLIEIRKASSRAAELVRRIMVFGRPREVEHETVDLAMVVDEVLQLLRSTLPAGILLKTEFASDTPRVDADPGQVHEVIVNLTTNAAYAIGPRSGTITYRLESVVIDERIATEIPGLSPGRHARLSVGDTGCGMDAVKLERIFDAFYTTKPMGEGTGLGLSMVHGIMKSHGGAVTAESIPGHGATFSLYFREVEVDVTSIGSADAGAGRVVEPRRVLYVDDEDALVLIAKGLLSRMGHSVAGFTDPEAALDHFGRHPDAFDVVVTDLSMPTLSGMEFARAVLAVRPEVPIVMTSGWLRSEDETAAHDIGIRELMLKPLSMHDLNHVIDRVARIRVS